MSAVGVHQIPGYPETLKRGLRMSRPEGWRKVEGPAIIQGSITVSWQQQRLLLKSGPRDRLFRAPILEILERMWGNDMQHYITNVQWILLIFPDFTAHLFGKLYSSKKNKTKRRPKTHLSSGVKSSWRQLPHCTSIFRILTLSSLMQVNAPCFATLCGSPRCAASFNETAWSTNQYGLISVRSYPLTSVHYGWKTHVLITLNRKCFSPSFFRYLERCGVGCWRTHKWTLQTVSNEARGYHARLLTPVRRIHPAA